MPAWIEQRAEHLLAKNPSMSKSTAYAVATQQSYGAGKNPKGFGTPEGKAVAKEKYDLPKKEYEKRPNPGKLDSPKMAGVSAAALEQYKHLMKYAFALAQYSGPPSRIKAAGAPLTPASRLSSTQQVGAPRTTSPPGPSIAEIAKPRGYGRVLPGADKS